MDDPTTDPTTAPKTEPISFADFRARQAESAPPPFPDAGPPGPGAADEATAIRRVLVRHALTRLQILDQHAQAIIRLGTGEGPTPEATLAARCREEASLIATLLTSSSSLA